MVNNTNKHDEHIAHQNEVIKKLATQLCSSVVPTVRRVSDEEINLPDELRRYQLAGTRGRPFSAQTLLFIYSIDVLDKNESAIFPMGAYKDANNALNHVKKRNPSNKYQVTRDLTANTVVVTNLGIKQSRRVFPASANNRPEPKLTAYDPFKDPRPLEDMSDTW